MSRHYLFAVLSLSLMLMPLGVAKAADGHDHSAHAGRGQHTATQPVAIFEGDPYPLGFDPVTAQPLVGGDHQITIVHQGREFRFNSAENANTFIANPVKYLPRVDSHIIAQQLPYYPLDTCVVSGEKLGGDMGDPINVVYKNRLVRFCCKMCTQEFTKDPGKYIQKIDAAVIAKQSHGYPLKTCITSGEALGTMGDPIQRVVANRLVKFCCAGCVKGFNKEPAKQLAKIDAAWKQQNAKTNNHGAHGDGHGGHQH